VIVQAYWTAGVKDRLVGTAINEQLHLTALWKALVVFGAALLTVAALRAFLKKWR
jgi:hypothetical protein